MGAKAMRGGTRILEQDVTEDCISERRLWTAVVAMAVEDWRNGSLRARREAQSFLLDDNADFRPCALTRVLILPLCAHAFSKSGSAFTCMGRIFIRLQRNHFFRASYNSSYS
jgi:hypothetical protein